MKNLLGILLGLTVATTCFGQGITQRWAYTLSLPAGSPFSYLDYAPDGYGGIVLYVRFSGTTSSNFFMWVNQDGVEVARTGLLGEDYDYDDCGGKVLPKKQLKFYDCNSNTNILLTVVGSSMVTNVLGELQGSWKGSYPANLELYEHWTYNEDNVLDSKGFFTKAGEATIKRYDFIFPNNPPTLADSQFGVSNGNVVVCWQGEIGQTYTIQKSTDITSTNWQDVSLGVAGTGVSQYWQDIYTMNTSAFYRVVQD